MHRVHNFIRSALRSLLDKLPGLGFTQPASPKMPTQTALPNIGDMGAVTLGEPDKNGDQAFVSRRPLNEGELAVAWDEHHARHGL